MKRFFYNQEGTANKFWFIDLQGSLVHITYGPVGSTSQRQTKYTNSLREADEMAEKLVKEKLRKGYVEVDGPSDIPPKQAPAVAAAPAPAPPPPPTTELRLLPEKVKGKRVQLVTGFDKFRLGGKPAVRKLLREAGATAIMPPVKNPADFIIGSAYLDHTLENPYHAPVLFEEELCAPLGPPPTGRLAPLRPAVLALVRRLARHPNILVHRFRCGPPATAADIARYEKKLKRPLPALLREVYQQIGELELRWSYRLPGTKPTYEDRLRHLDRHHNLGGGGIRLPLLREVVSDNWRKPEKQLDLAPDQGILDEYDGDYPVAIDLGRDDDPWLHPGRRQGPGREVRFAAGPPIRLSQYLALVLTTFGAQRERPARLAQAAAQPQPLAEYLAALAGGEFPNPFGEELQNKEAIEWLDDLLPVLEGYAQVNDETRFFDQLEYSVEHRQFALGSIERAAGPHTRQLLALPRAAALRARAATTDPTPGRVAFTAGYINYLGSDDDLSANVNFTNPSGRDNAVLGYRARLLVRFGYPTNLPAPRADVQLHEYDSVSHDQHFRRLDDDYLEYTRPDGRVQREYQYVHDLPFALPARSRCQLKLFLHDINWQAQLHALGITKMPKHGYPRVLLQVEFRLADPTPGPPLTLEAEIDAYFR